MREFITAVTAESKALDDITDEERIGAPITVKIDGREVVFKPPTITQLAMILALEGASVREMVGGFLNFFFALQEDKDVAHFRRRLFDREDPFSVVHVRDIVSELTEEWSARPTQSPTGSSASRGTSGKRSTARPRSKA